LRWNADENRFRQLQSRGMVTHYARQVNQKKLAAAAVLEWQAAAEPGRTKNETDPSL
jgi:hypothetical protein